MQPQDFPIGNYTPLNQKQSTNGDSKSSLILLIVLILIAVALGGVVLFLLIQKSKPQSLVPNTPIVEQVTPIQRAPVITPSNTPSSTGSSTLDAAEKNLNNVDVSSAESDLKNLNTNINGL